jgi:lipopolysaccharide export system protein LptA
VTAEHESTKFFCDSALFYPDTDVMEAYGNVNVRESDTLNLFGEKLIYDGKTKISVITENVSLADPQVTLTTDKLIYDGNKDLASYITWGEIVSKSNVLVSKKGYYYTQDKYFIFHDEVVLENPQYLIYTDTLHYNTTTEIAFLYGPSVIRSNENTIYCERGWYDTQKDIASFMERAWLTSNEHKIGGDSLYYDRNLSYGRAYRNVEIHDTLNNFIVYGQFGEYFEDNGQSFITDSAYAVMIDDSDSLFLHADSLHITFDTLQQGKLFKAYHQTKFFRNDFQGAADSIVYNFTDSTVKMYHAPVIWFDDTEAIADSITLLFQDGQLFRMFLHSASFINSQDAPEKYNQIKGKNVTGFFNEGVLKKMHVESNSETIYYVRDEHDALIGINKAVSNSLRIEFKNGEVSGIVFIEKPVGTIFPEKELRESEKYLKGFSLRTKERPLTKEDIFFQTPAE